MTNSTSKSKKLIEILKHIKNKNPFKGRNDMDSIINNGSNHDSLYQSDNTFLKKIKPLINGSHYLMDKTLRGLSGAGYFMAVNGAVLGGYYFGWNHCIEPLISDVFNPAGLDAFTTYMDHNPFLKDTLALIPYAATLSLVNIGVPKLSLNLKEPLLKKIKINGFASKYAAIPYSTKLLTKKRQPNLTNYLKTVAYGGLLLSCINMGADFNNSKFNKHNKNPSPSISNQASNINETSTNYLSTIREQLFGVGEYVHDLFHSTKKNIKKLYSNITNIINDMSENWFPVDKSESIEIEKTLNNSKIINPNFDYENDPLAKRLKPLIECGMFENPEMAIYTARVINFEAINKKKAMQDVAQVIFNRWKYDNWKEKMSGNRPFSQNKGNTMGQIVFSHRKNKRNNIVYEFTAIGKNPKYFHPTKLTKYNMYSNDRLNVAVGDMDPNKARISMEALINVLYGLVSDRTKQATFYQNPRRVDKFNNNWEARYGLKKTGYKFSGHIFYKHPDQPNLDKYNYLTKLLKSYGQRVIAKTQGNYKTEIDSQTVSSKNTQLENNPNLKSKIIIAWDKLYSAIGKKYNDVSSKVKNFFSSNDVSKKVSKAHDKVNSVREKVQQKASELTENEYKKLEANFYYPVDIYMAQKYQKTLPPNIKSDISISDLKLDELSFKYKETKNIPVNRKGEFLVDKVDIYEYTTIKQESIENILLAFKVKDEIGVYNYYIDFYDQNMNLLYSSKEVIINSQKDLSSNSNGNLDKNSNDNSNNNSIDNLRSHTYKIDPDEKLIIFAKKHFDEKYKLVN